MTAGENHGFERAQQPAADAINRRAFPNQFKAFDPLVTDLQPAGEIGDQGGRIERAGARHPQARPAVSPGPTSRGFGVTPEEAFIQ